MSDTGTQQAALGPHTQIADLDRLNAPVLREAYTRSEARQAIGIGVTKFWELEKAGLIKVRQIGAKGLILRSDLLAFLEALPTADPKSRAA